MRGSLWDEKVAAETLQPWRGPPLVGVEGTPLQVCGCANETVCTTGINFTPRVVVIDDVNGDATQGMDFMEENCAHLM